MGSSLAQTAYTRMLENPEIAQEVKEQLRRKCATLDPLILRQERDRIMSKLLKIKTRLR
jgi:hypothetical protein